MSGVVVVGSVNLDVLVGVPRLPEQGETVLGRDAVYRPGGKGSNQAVAAHRMGAEVTLFAACGDDPFGTDLRTALEREGLDLSPVHSLPGVPTGVALVVVTDDGRHTITVAPGANLHLQPSHLAALPGTLTGSSTLMLQCEVPIATSLAAARVARDAGARVVLNAAPMPTRGEQLTELLGLVDVLVVNEIEAAQLTGAASPDGTAGWTSVARELRRLGPSTVVITLGAQGAVAAGDGGTYSQSPFRVDAVDGTGAGDTFCGALTVDLAEGRELELALRRACAAGALATTRVGAQAALPEPADVDRLLDEDSRVGS